MSEISDFGTNEAIRHFKTKLEPRGISNGGRVITVGLRNLIPDLLEAIYDAGHLQAKNERQSHADRRVADGRAFQELYQLFKSKGRDTAATEMVYRMMPTLIGHIGSPRDIAETVYNEVLRRMRSNGAVVYALCIEGHLNSPADVIRHALDALPGAMEVAEQKVSFMVSRETKNEQFTIP